MKRLFISLLLCASGSVFSNAQDYWTLLAEYPSPANYALGLYFDGKLLWHVDWDSAANTHTIYTVNPYNLEVIDIYPSPITQPWGITFDGRNFWMTSHGLVGQAHSQLVRLRQDTLAVDTSFVFDGYYFYGIAYNTETRYLWIAAQTQQYLKRFLEFNPQTCQVVAWHVWPWTWSLGLQYFDGKLWCNTYDYYYPDHTKFGDSFGYFTF